MMNGFMYYIEQLNIIFELIHFLSIILIIAIIGISDTLDEKCICSKPHSRNIIF